MKATPKLMIAADIQQINYAGVRSIANKGDKRTDEATIN